MCSLCCKHNVPVAEEEPHSARTSTQTGITSYATARSRPTGDEKKKNSIFGAPGWNIVCSEQYTPQMSLRKAETAPRGMREVIVEFEAQPPQR